MQREELELWMEELELWREELELQRGELTVLWEQAGMMRELVGSQDYIVQVLCRIERCELILRTCAVEGPSGTRKVPKEVPEKQLEGFPGKEPEENPEKDVEESPEKLPEHTLSK